MKPSNARAIFVSLAGNIGISLSKFVAAAFTGSAAVLAEAVHSLVDISHELLLLLGVRQAQAPADERFPYGQGKAVYFWGLIAVIFFTVGGVFAFVNGLQQLMHPEPLDISYAAYIVLTVGLVFEQPGAGGSAAAVHAHQGQHSLYVCTAQYQRVDAHPDLTECA